MNHDFITLRNAYRRVHESRINASSPVFESTDSVSDVNTIFNEPCEVTMNERLAPNSVDIVLTSPPYDTTVGRMSRKTLSDDVSVNKKGRFPSYRYDVFTSTKTPEQYIDWTVSLFNSFDHILKRNGVVIYNISYTADDTETMWIMLGDVIRRTNFTVADHIVWKKHQAIPNNTSPNRLTRIVEDVFVFCRKSEKSTFICSKEVSSVRSTGQRMFHNVLNYIEAANNDGSNPHNKATYSSELCEKLLRIYGKREMVIYDPFMGTGTTAVAARRLGMNYVGSELSKDQVGFANDRISRL